MKYLTKSLMQRFMSHMSEDISWIQSEMAVERDYAIAEAIKFGASSETTRRKRDKLSDLYCHFSRIQTSVRYFPLKHFVLQQMEKRVTIWISYHEFLKQDSYEDYLENRYDTFYRNKSKQAKQKLKKLVELQQAIRKQKSISGDSF